MAKVQDYDIKGLPQEQSDFNEDVQIILNYGKYQSQYNTSAPTWIARRGETVYVESSGVLYQYVCRVDNSSTWLAISSANIP